MPGLESVARIPDPPGRARCRRHPGGRQRASSQSDRFRNAGALSLHSGPSPPASVARCRARYQIARCCRRLDWRHRDGDPGHRWRFRPPCSCRRNPSAESRRSARGASLRCWIEGKHDHGGGQFIDHIERLPGRREGKVSRAGSRLQRDESGIVRRQRASVRVEPIDQDLVDPEVRHQDKSVVTGGLDEVGVRAGLTLRIHTEPTSWMNATCSPSRPSSPTGNTATLPLL